MRLGWVLSALALLATGIASIATPDRHARTAVRSPARSTTEAARLPVALPERQISGKAKADPFAPRDWAPHAPPTAVRAVREQEPAPAPGVPPNPYRFAGTAHYGGSLKAVFIREERVHLALPGETLDGDYKLLSVTRDAVTLLYTPLDIQQRIALAWDSAPDIAALSQR